MHRTVSGASPVTGETVKSARNVGFGGGVFTVIEEDLLLDPALFDTVRVTLNI